jgi:hypothetical protein
LGYLYFILMSALMILIVIALMFFTRAKEKPNPRLNQKSKSPRNMAQSPSTIPAGQIKNLIGRKYIPSYQSDPAVAKQVDRFLSGATSRSDNSVAEKQSDADEDAGEKDEKEAIKAQKAVQLELGMGDTKDQLTAVNE